MDGPFGQKLEEEIVYFEELRTPQFFFRFPDLSKFH